MISEASVLEGMARIDRRDTVARKAQVVHGTLDFRGTAFGEKASVLEIDIQPTLSGQ